MTLPEVQLPHKCWSLFDHCCSQVFVQVYLQRLWLRWSSYQRAVASRWDRPLSQQKISFGNRCYLEHFCVSCAAHVSLSWEVVGARIWLQNVVFEEGCKEEALENARRGNSKLEAFFLLNREYPQARHLLYTDIIGDYTWNNNTKKWRQRRRNCPFTVCRMNSVTPRDQERFHLRLPSSAYSRASELRRFGHS